jgi:[ribosomal protein S18]-alanine N-acetyltransferase
MIWRTLFAREPILSAASPHDAAPIAALHAMSFRRGWSEDEVKRLIGERNVVTHRAMQGNALAGFIMSRLAADEAEILTVAVARAAQGCGLARRLLDLHLRRLAGLGCRSVFLDVDENNRAAIRLYQRAGFREVARRAGYYPAPSGQAAAALVLRRDLS